MSLLLASSVLFGLFVIAVRGPFVFAPAEALEFYRERVFGSPARGRMVGALMGALGVPMFVSAQGVQGTFPGLITLVGAAFVFWMIALIVAPGPFLRLVLAIMDLFGAQALRVAGVGGVVFGVAWIYFSFTQLS